MGWFDCFQKKNKIRIESPENELCIFEHAIVDRLRFLNARSEKLLRIAKVASRFGEMRRASLFINTRKKIIEEQERLVKQLMEVSEKRAASPQEKEAVIRFLKELGLY